jgi:hypothetical protein
MGKSTIYTDRNGVSFEYINGIPYMLNGQPYVKPSNQNDYPKRTLKEKEDYHAEESRKFLGKKRGKTLTKQEKGARSSGYVARAKQERDAYFYNKNKGNG